MSLARTAQRPARKLAFVIRRAGSPPAIPRLRRWRLDGDIDGDENTARHGALYARDAARLGLVAMRIAEGNRLPLGLIAVDGSSVLGLALSADAGGRVAIQIDAIGAYFSGDGFHFRRSYLFRQPRDCC